MRGFHLTEREARITLYMLSFNFLTGGDKGENSSDRTLKQLAFECVCVLRD